MVLSSYWATKLMCHSPALATGASWFLEDEFKPKAFHEISELQDDLHSPVLLWLWAPAFAEFVHFKDPLFFLL